MTIEEYLAVPYILQVWSRKRSDGQWIRHAEFPELGIAVEAFSTLEALERVDDAREAYIIDCLKRGREIPVPRQPLRV